MVSRCMINPLKRELVLECQLKGSFKTRSGQMVDRYFDKYRFEGNPELLRRLTDELAELIPPGVELLAGLEMGGIPLVTAISLKTGIPACFVRKKAKPHGTQAISEGPSPSGKRVLIVEDVTTTGGQILLSAKDLQDAGADLAGVLLAIARSQDAVCAMSEAQLDAFIYIGPEELSEIVKGE